jgi:hypothetical protein
MSEDSEKMKRLITFKKKLENQAEQLDMELKEVQTMLETVNWLLLEKGFKHMEIPKETAKTPSATHEEQKLPPFETEAASATQPQENVTQLKTADGEPLAELLINEIEESLHVVPARDKNFNVNTPPFTQFLVERVLQKMRERDEELVKTGQINPEKVFSYDIVHEDNLLREIFIRNIDADRLKELKLSIRWTLEKMHEKTSA